MKIVQVTVTPEKAKLWLTKNVGNRPIRESNVQRFVEVIKSGEYKMTHQGVAFDKKGNLIDGQHRLHAVVRAGRSVEMMVARGCDPATFAYIDQGAFRSASDILGTDRRVAEVCRYIARLASGGPTYVSPRNLKIVYERIGPAIIGLLDGARTTSRAFSAAPMRVAAVTTVLMGGRPEYVKDVYRNLVAANVDDLPRVGKALVSQHLRGGLNTSLTGDLLARGMTVFCEKSADTTRVQVKDHGVTVERVRNFYRSLFPELNPVS